MWRRCFSQIHSCGSGSALQTRAALPWTPLPGTALRGGVPVLVPNGERYGRDRHTGGCS